MEEVPVFSRLFLLWAPLLLTLGLSRWFGWIGLAAALSLTLALFLLIATMFGESGWSDSSNPVVHAAYVGAFWGWVAGVGCAVALFVGWCRRNMKAANQ